MKYKYIGTEEQLVARGFAISGKIYPYANRGYNNRPKDALYISLSEKYSGAEYREIMFNLAFRKDDITPYIQDLIDDGLVEVLS